MLILNILFLCNMLISGFGDEMKHPTVFVSTLVRNKAHTLPYFLSNLENLNYPKERISLW